MNQALSSKLRPAMIGGALTGGLSAIPFVNLPNMCCLWWILGGMLATHLYIRSATPPVSLADGAAVGALAGLIAASIAIFIGVPLALLLGDPVTHTIMFLLERAFARFDQRAATEFRRVVEQELNKPFLERLIASIPGMMLSFVVTMAIMTVSGLIAIPLFGKHKRAGGMYQPPPLPPTFS